MDKDMNLEFLKGFADAQRVLDPISCELAGIDAYAWDKLYRIRRHLNVEQRKIGEAYFADQEAA